MSDPKVEEFLEHFGVRGMRWGISKVKHTPLSRKQKIGVSAVGVAGFVAGNNFILKRTLNVPLSVAAGAATAAVGVRLTRNWLDEKGNTPLSELDK